MPVGRGRVPQEVQPRRGRRLLPLGRHPPVRRRQAQPGREALEGDRRDIRERKRRHGRRGGEDGGTAVAAAIASYQQAAELFEMEQAKSQASSCLQKVAELCSGALDPPEMLRAAEIYEGLGRQCLESNLLKYNAKTHFLNGILCHLANGDSIGASQALARSDGLDYTLADSREGKFARSLVECVEGFDAEGFATACFEYDRISKLDPWKTSLLVVLCDGGMLIIWFDGGIHPL